MTSPSIRYANWAPPRWPLPRGGGEYNEEEEDPLNAPEVLEAVARFKILKLEGRDANARRRRADYVDAKLREEVNEAKVRLGEEMERREEEERTRREGISVGIGVVLGGPPPPPPGLLLPCLRREPGSGSR